MPDLNTDVPDEPAPEGVQWSEGWPATRLPAQDTAGKLPASTLKLIQRSRCTFLYSDQTKINRRKISKLGNGTLPE